MMVNETKSGVVARFSTMAINYLMTRLDRIQQSVDPRRNLERECGWPEVDPGCSDYQRMYERNPIAGRVVEVFPRQSWQVQPEVYEDEDPNKQTPFEQDWADLPKQINPIPSFFQGVKVSPIWEVLKRADELSGIGKYAVILLGLDDNKGLEEPATPRNGQKLTFLRVFPEQYAAVKQWDDDENSPRYGRPISYSLTFNNPRGTNEGGQTSDTKEVHYTRVIHIADNLQSSEVLGTPRQKPVWNNILDLRKLYGGSAEMYWKGAFPGIGFEGLPEAMKGAKLNLEDMKEEIEDFMNGLQRYYAIVGAKGRVLAPAVVDPSPQINVQLEAICIKLNIPKRVFMGSERGELSSGQDDAAWNDILRERQLNYLSPRVIAIFVDHLIWLMVLREPTKYNILWPDLTSQTPQEKSHVAFERSQALAQFANSRAPELMSFQHFLTDILGFTEQQAIAIDKATGKREPAPIAVPVKPGANNTLPNGSKQPLGNPGNAASSK